MKERQSKAKQKSKEDFSFALLCLSFIFSLIYSLQYINTFRQASQHTKKEKKKYVEQLRDPHTYL